jgi:ACS family hexuronate transporter-like MFS transporter
LRLRRFWVLVVLVVAVNQPWQFFRAWLVPLLDALHYSRKEALLFSSAYYTAADAGSLAAGFLTLAFLRRGLGVHRARLTVYLGAALLTAVSVVAAPLPAGPLLLGLLLVIAFGSLGLMPTYYSFTQDLTVRHQGLLTGLLGFTTWLVTAAMQLGVGKRLEETGTHGLAMAAVGLVPLIGFAALIFCWKEKGGGRPAPDSALPVGSKAEAGD